MPADLRQRIQGLACKHDATRTSSGDLRHGYEDQDAFIRARVLYFMQIGYYALELGETTPTRMKYIADYLRCFTGQEPPVDAVTKYVDRLRAKASA